MRVVTRSTKASGHEYTVEIAQFDDLDEVREVMRDNGVTNPDEAILGIVNAQQEQNGKQGAKDPVREAISEHGVDSPETEEAIAAAQEYAANYRIGAPRGAQAGPTKKSQHEFGEAVTKAMQEKGGTLSQAELDELREEYEIV